MTNSGKKSRQYIEIALVCVALFFIVSIAPLCMAAAGNAVAKMCIRYLLYTGMAAMGSVVCKIQKRPVFSSLGLSKAHLGKQLLTALPVFAVTAVLIIIAPICFGVNKQILLGAKQTDTVQILLYIVLYMVFVGPGEEIIFRGYLFESIKEASSSGTTAAVISSALFGLWHFPGSQDFLQVGTTFIMGLLWCFARVKLKNCSTLTTGVAHGLHDCFNMIL